jgi:IclR family transcriptional regulator, mhp operon transcriptional activator
VRTLTAGFHSEPKAIEVAAPILEALTARHKWPMTLTVLDDMAAVVRYSTIPSSPLSLLHSTVGLRHSLVSRALGRAILAFCEPDERDAIIAQLAQSTQPEDQAARDRDRFVALLGEIRAQGYAMRDPAVRPVSNTIAVPIYDHGHVLGSIGLTWFSSTHKPQEAVRRYLGDLQDAATEISRRLSM